MAAVESREQLAAAGTPADTLAAAVDDTLLGVAVEHTQQAVVAVVGDMLAVRASEHAHAPLAPAGGSQLSQVAAPSAVLC